jgi:hypothetical protein
MSAATPILEELARLGVAARADGETIKLKPRALINDDLLARVKARKPEILTVISARPTTCAPTCYVVEPDKSIHRPWDGCKTCITPAVVMPDPPAAAEQTASARNTLAIVSAKSNEWYTPEKYIEAAREVLGSFDLDPASCLVANTVVKAQKFYTLKDDGLTKEWFGRVWLNPPYGDAGPKFVAKLLQAYKDGHVTEAIVLVNSHCTDAKWFRPLFDYVVCFTDHRPKFWTKDGEGGSPTHGSAIVYLGKNDGLFLAVFNQFGAVVSKHKGSSGRYR